MISARKFISFFLSFTFLFIASAINTSAQIPLETTKGYPSPTPLVVPTNTPTNQQDIHSQTQQVVIALTSSLSCLMLGTDTVNPTQPCLGVDKNTGAIGYIQNQGGAINAMGGLIAGTFKIPVSSSDYTSYLSSNFGIVKPAYAQNADGFEGLKPVLKLWIGFRNVVYLLFVLAFILVGLGIMFRIQTDPRTVMTIQNQIPKVIVALILVTLSYAIAGFIVDMMWVITFLIVKVIADFSALDLLPKFINDANTPPIGFVNNLYPGGFWGIASTAADGVGSVIRQLTHNNPMDYTSKFQLAASPCSNLVGLDALGCWVDKAIVSTVGALLSSIVGWIISWVVQALAIIVITIALFVALFRVWFMLLKAYIFFLMDVIFSPFWIISGILPGGPGFGGWLRSIISNISPFPVVITMLLLGVVILEGLGGGTTAPFVPPLLGNPDPNSLEFLRGIIALGIILTTPEVLAMVKDALKAPTIKYTAAIGQSLGAGMAAPGRVVGGGLSMTLGTHYEKVGDEIKLVGGTGPIGRFLRSFGFIR